MPASRDRSFSIRVAPEDAGSRLDAFLTSAFPEISRSVLSRLIRRGDVRVAGARLQKPSHKMSAGDIVSGTLPGPDDGFPEPEPVALDILFEDDDILVVNKPPGLVVHPGPGHASGSLVHGLLFHRPGISAIGEDPTRPGIVHRLDKDTSGVLIIAKTDAAYQDLIAQFKARTTQKRYLGIVFGVPDKASGKIVLPIGRHPTQRKKMHGTDPETGRHAETLWRVRKSWERLALMEFDLKTGRTHQIRVHCAAIRHPIVGDAVYGPKRPRKFCADDPLIGNIIASVPRQMLHAWRLCVKHPKTQTPMTWEAPLPEDMKDLAHRVHAWLKNRENNRQGP